MSDITKEVAAIYESILPGKPVNNSHIVANLLRILLDLHEHLTCIEGALNDQPSNNPTTNDNPS